MLKRDVTELSSGKLRDANGASTLLAKEFFREALIKLRVVELCSPLTIPARMAGVRDAQRITLFMALLTKEYDSISLFGSDGLRQGHVSQAQGAGRYEFTLSQAHGSRDKSADVIAAQFHESCIFKPLDIKKLRYLPTPSVLGESNAHHV
jgi:hypothetical protein